MGEDPLNDVVVTTDRSFNRARQRQQVPWRALREVKENREENEVREKEKNRGCG